jgi:sensor histidine kinase YesM
MFQEHGIDLQYKGDMSPLRFMKQVDCCILLSNLIDNAIEANSKVEKERYIKVTAKATGGLFYLEIANPMKGQLIREDDKILTTKEDREKHGIGLSNVYDIIASYEGTYQIEEQEGEYKIQISFPL